MTRGPESKSSQRKILALQRQKEALSLRQAGLTLQEIATKLTCSKQAVGRMIDKAMQAYKDDIKTEVDNLRALELARLDALQIAVSKIIMETQNSRVDLKAVSQQLDIMKQRAELLGLNRKPGIDDSGVDGAGAVVRIEITGGLPDA